MAHERFQVLRRLGEGGMGVVQEALDRDANVRLAVKRLRNLGSEAVGRFKNEFRVLQDLAHPNLVQLGELFEEQGELFYTMELVEGVDFCTYICGAATTGEPAAREREPHLALGSGPSSWTDSSRELSGTLSVPRRFDEVRLRASFTQLVGALAMLHGAGKVHRDIKPSNILVTSTGRVVVLDFGLVTGVTLEDASMETHIVGTTTYMAPEQAAASRVGPAADWYAVGVLLHEVLTGKVPFDGHPLQILIDKQQREAPRPSDSTLGVPDDLDRLCARLLAFDPATRPGADEVLACLSGRSVSPSSARAQGTMPRPSFVGRDRELAVLRVAFEETRRRLPATVVIRGESGVGKSALVRHFAATVRAEAPQTVVLSGRCYERESVPYKAFDGAIDDLCRHLSRLDPVDAALIVGHEGALVARLFPALARVAPVRRSLPSAQEVPHPQELRNRAFAALRVLLRQLTERAPLILYIDDLQWADVDSLHLLDELLRADGAPPLLLVATMRSNGPPSSAFPDNTHHIDLGGLTDDDARALVELLSARIGPQGGGGEAIDAAALAREAGGHPLFLHELVRFVAEGPDGDRPAAKLDDALHSRVQRLDPRARALLEVLAVAGVPVPLKIAAQAAALEAAEMGRQTNVLRAAMLARSGGLRAHDPIEPYHDRVRESVTAHLTDDARRAIHRRLADAIESAEPHLQDPRMLVTHLRAAGHDERAARHAEHAADLATEALAFDQAAEFYRIALALGQHGDDKRRGLLVRLGEVLVNVGRCAEAADVYLSAAALGDAAARIEYRRRAGEQLLVSGHVERGLATLETVLADAGLRLASTPRRALASLVWGRLRLRVRGLGWRERDASQVAPRVLEQLECHRAVISGLAMVDNIRGAAFQARGIALALRTGQPAGVARALGTEAIFRASEGVSRRPRVDKLIAEVSAIAAQQKHDPFLDAWLSGLLGSADYLTGKFTSSTEHLRRGEDALRALPAAATWELNNVRVFLLYSLRQLGAARELSTRFDDYIRDAGRRGDRYIETTMSRALNIVWLFRDDPARARRELAQKTWSPPDTGFLHLQHWYELRARTEIDLYEGAPPDAASFLADWTTVDKSLLTRVQIVRVEGTWLRGRVALAAGDLATASRCARALAREGVGYATVWSQLLAALVAGKRGETARAALLFERAIELGDANQLRLYTAVARLRLAELLAAQDPARADELRAHALAWMSSEAIRAPERVAAMIAPWPCAR